MKSNHRVTMLLAVMAGLPAAAVAAAPPPPPWYIVSTTRSGVGNGWYPNQCGGCAVGGSASYFGPLYGWWGGTSPGGGMVAAGLMAYDVSSHIDSGSAINVEFGAGGSSDDGLYIDDPTRPTDALVPILLTRSLVGSYTASYHSGTGGGPAPGGSVSIGFGLVTDITGEISVTLPSFSTSVNLTEQHYGSVWNRHWLNFNTWMNSSLVTSGDNPNALDVSGSVSIVPVGGPGTRLYNTGGQIYPAVPEPSTMLMMFGGMAALGGWLRRRASGLA